RSLHDALPISCTHHQCRTANTRPVIPSHLCRRYILSRPPRGRSIGFGLVASIMATLIMPSPMTPVYWTKTLRKENQLSGSGKKVSARSHAALSAINNPPKSNLMFLTQTSSSLYRPPYDHRLIRLQSHSWYLTHFPAIR